ncbi:MAG: DUF4118 domain-containing protein [Herminiimonas sp.]|nr:DUF4118 domain-containing protein [Herminiimonas sp.]
MTDIEHRTAPFVPEPVGYAPQGDKGPSSRRASLSAWSDRTAIAWLPKQGHAGIAIAIAASLATALLATPLLPYLDLANIVMLFMLTVLIVALTFGRAPAITASLVSVAAFDYFFVPPRFSFSVTNGQYLVTFCVMLAVGIVTGNLASGLRHEVLVSGQRERRARALYEFARDLSRALGVEQVCEWTRQALQDSLETDALLLLPNAAGRLTLPAFSAMANPHGLHLSVLDLAIAQWAFDNAAPAGRGTVTVPASAYSFVPLIAPMRARGVLAIRNDPAAALPASEQGTQLDAFAALAAIALERVHYIAVAQEAVLHAESERLRNSLLASVSHDLRTPLTSLLGLSESLAMSQPSLSPAQGEMAGALRDEAQRMCRSVENLLEMARIQSGNIRLNQQWQSFEEVAGAALRASRPALAAHLVRTRLAPDLPLVRCDAMLIERVLCNLVENAAKYTPPGTVITLGAAVAGDWLSIQVSDNGPGLPPGREKAIFDKFVRGGVQASGPGVGLGLSICRSLVEAHGGAIKAANAVDGGACFTFRLPLSAPPGFVDMELDDITPAAPAGEAQ